ncbi:MAG: DUF4184 family protein [Planctomycetaceae bacterium]
MSFFSNTAFDSGRTIPFTPTHIAAVVPIAAMRTRLPFTALVIGSMVPDIAVFFPSLVAYLRTHSLVGVVTVCPLIGWACHSVFLAIMQRPLIALLPAWIQHRLPEDREVFRWRESAAVLMASGLGAATHVFWDSFTHTGRWGTTLIPALNSVAFNYGDRTFLWSTTLQYGFTFVLLPVLMSGAWVKLNQREHTSRPFTLSRRWKAAAAVVCLLIPISCCAWFFTEAESSYILLGQTVKYTGAIYILLALGFSIFITARFGSADGSLSHSQKVQSAPGGEQRPPG